MPFSSSTLAVKLRFSGLPCTGLLCTEDGIGDATLTFGETSPNTLRLAGCDRDMGLGFNVVLGLFSSFVGRAIGEGGIGAAAGTRVEELSGCIEVSRLRLSICDIAGQHRCVRGSVRKVDGRRDVDAASRVLWRETL